MWKQPSSEYRGVGAAGIRLRERDAAPVPEAGIVLTVLSVNLAGEALDDLLDPRAGR